MRPPFILRSVCWPRPLEITAGPWNSAAAWDAPVMDMLPPWKLLLNGETHFWSIDWRDHFRAGAKRWNPHQGGEMRGFQVVFRLEILESGVLVLAGNDGCIVRRGGIVIHEAPSGLPGKSSGPGENAKPRKRPELKVGKGDLLEIAQRFAGEVWQWCARLQPEARGARESAGSVFRPYLGQVERLLRHPTGPPLKMYTDGRHPLRAVAGIYSMALNGYTPASVLLFGEEQWSDRSRSIFSSLLPFARTVPAAEASAHLRRYGGAALVRKARQRWFIMKTGVALFMPPAESCMMDDDILVLDPVSDALDAFSRSDLVYCQDQDLGQGYTRHWGGIFGHSGALPTARFNAGLYWIRNIPDRRRLAALALRCDVKRPVFWEQGFIALAFARRRTWQLPSTRYNFVVFDGLPGGLYGYDYARNPCGFATIHYGNLAEKPSDAFSLQVLEDVLERRRNPAFRGRKRARPA